MAVEKCFCVKLDKGCLCLGAGTFVLSCCILITAITCVTLEYHQTSTRAVVSADHTHILHLSWPQPVIHVALGIVLVTCVLWMLFSVVLFVGIKKGHAACVMSYFLFGVFLSLILMVTALLMLVKKLWPASLAILLFTLLFIRCLYSVFTAYDLLRQGKTLDDQQPLMLEEDFDVNIN